MELIRGLQNLQPLHRGCVATIGNFDGVHLGHQAVIGQLAKKAAELKLPTTVILFEPQPLEFFVGNKAPARLMRLRDKAEALSHLHVDRLLCVRFDKKFAEMTAEAFIHEVLVEGLGVRYVEIGDDFHFGAGRKGDFNLLKEAGKQYDFDVAAMHTVTVGGARVSSTRIREVLVRADMVTAQELLGRPYEIWGRVAHGKKLGRTLGVPTANIYLHRKTAPLAGIYVVEVVGLGPKRLRGVANVGTRPTVDGTRALLEVNIFDFDADIYGRYVGVDFLQKLRDEQRFESLDELRVWMERDIAQARSYFSSRSAIPHR